jgi:hypothetical protein
MLPQSFKKGESGNPNGRPKGAKNKIRFDVAEILKAEKCNPFKILAQIALGNTDYNNDRPITAYLRKDAAAELAGYVAPKLKSVEITSDQLDNFTVMLNYAPPKDNNGG